jgi:DNA repair exonuclease SbcCD nuclease subunit
VIETNILGHKIALVHGNYDSVNTVSERLSQSFGYLFQYIMMGHIHHHYEKEIGLHTQIIVNSSLIGSDDYAVQKRLISKPAQKFLVFDCEGLECEYNIQLNMV